uniref:Reverse transcriptase Ty1/copia-type domain-containing protein n=1 Tax=Strigamia maritima TaxID=126957 RepID=T1IRC0_STRMM
MILFADTDHTKQKILKKIEVNFDIVDLGQIRKILGVEFILDGKRAFMSQTAYILKLAYKYKLVPNSLVKVPATVGTTLTRDLNVLPNEFSYRSLIGSLSFLASRMRPDILYSVIVLSQYNGAHTTKHVKALMQVLQYVLNTAEYSIDMS